MSERKKLIINNVLYAEYEMGELEEVDTLFLKLRKEIVPGNIRASEDVCQLIIAALEKKDFDYVAYLNIE